MGTYLMMLYVSLEQEVALKDFFVDKGWPYRKPDLATITEHVGPLTVEAVPHDLSTPIPTSLLEKDTMKRKRTPAKNKNPIAKKAKNVRTSLRNPIMKLVTITAKSDEEFKQLTTGTPDSAVAVGEVTETFIEENVQDGEEETVDIKIEPEDPDYDQAEDMTDMEYDGDEINDTKNDFNVSKSDRILEKDDFVEYTGEGTSGMGEDDEAFLTSLKEEAKKPQNKKRTSDCKSIQTKYDAILEVEKGQKKKSQIARQLGIAQSTLSTWLKNKDHIKMGYKRYNPKRKMMRLGLYRDVEEATFKWLKYVQDQNIPLTGPKVLKIAARLAANLGKTEFKASNGWLERFKGRYGIILKRNKTVSLAKKSDEVERKSKTVSVAIKESDEVERKSKTVSLAKESEVERKSKTVSLAKESDEVERKSKMVSLAKGSEVERKSKTVSLAKKSDEVERKSKMVSLAKESDAVERKSKTVRLAKESGEIKPS